MAPSPLSSGSHVLGKLIVVGVAAYVFADWLTTDAVAGHARAATLTADAYAAEFEAFRAKLTSGSTSLPFNLLIASLMMFGLFGMYEVFAHGVSLVIDRAKRWRGGEAGDAV